MPKHGFLKLVKYNGRAVAKEMSIYYILLVVSAIIARGCEGFVGGFVPALIKGFAEGFFFSMLFTTMINSVIRVWRQFNHTMYGPESYLTHALPVKTTTIFWAMMAVGILSTLVSMVLSGLMVLLAFAGTDAFEGLMLQLSEIATILNTTTPLLLTELVATVLCEIWSVLFIGILADILGHKANNNQIGWAVLYGFLLYSAVQIVIFGLVYYLAEKNDEISNFFGQANLNLANLDSVLLMATGGYSLMLLMFALSSRHLLSRGVNVE